MSPAWRTAIPADSRRFGGYGIAGASNRVDPDVYRAPVAQLDRAAASEAVGQKFESSRAHQIPLPPCWIRAWESSGYTSRVKKETPERPNGSLRRFGFAGRLDAGAVALIEQTGAAKQTAGNEKQRAGLRNGRDTDEGLRCGVGGRILAARNRRVEGELTIIEGG